MNEVIAVKNFYQRYGKLVAVRGIDFTVERGEIFGLIGPDGAGKTTTFHMLGGVRSATSGQIQVLGKSPRDARLEIGYLTQQMSLYLDLSVEENLRYSAGLRQVPENLFGERREKYLRLMSLEQFSDRLAGRLSGGMKQKLALCCALISQPEILLLDEPTTGVDPISRREFWDVLAAVASQGVTIVVATPYLDEAERCHRIALMYEGAIQEIGTLSQLRENLGLQRLEIRSQNILAAEQALLAAKDSPQSNLVDIQTFGDRLDILVKNVDAGKLQVSQILTKKRIPFAEIQATTPTLENVFVTRLRAVGSEPEFIPFPRTVAPRSFLTSHNSQNSSGQSSLQNNVLLDEVSEGANTGGNLSSSAGAEKLKIAILPSNAKAISLRDAKAILPSNAKAIEANLLRKVFGDFVAVQQVDLAIAYGEIYGLLGANGAGKTTTIKMLCGLLEPTRGRISLAGQTSNLRSSAVRQKIGYMSQRFTLYDDLTIQQNLEFYCGVYQVPQKLRREKIDWVLSTCGLVGRETMLTGQLPGGWKQRVAFGASVMHEPKILFLDEPTSGVDPAGVTRGVKRHM